MASMGRLWEFSGAFPQPCMEPVEQYPHFVSTVGRRKSGVVVEIQRPECNSSKCRSGDWTRGGCLWVIPTWQVQCIYAFGNHV